MSRLLLSAGLILSAPLVAAAPNNAPTQAGPPQRSAHLVLASADSASTRPQGSQSPTTAPKPRIARVTSCRCGDPQPDSGTEEQ